jgi:hypothetical protein
MADPHEDDANAYLPSRAEIREGCQRIQSTWDEHERRRRAAGLTSDGVLPAVEAPCYSVTRTQRGMIARPAVRGPDLAE